MAHPVDDSHAWKVWVGSIVSVVAATFAVTARLVARKLSEAPFWWDDYTIVASLFVQWGMGISRWIPLICWKYGHHTLYVGKDNMEHFQKTFIAIQTLYFLNSTLTKISLLLLFHRIFGVVGRFRFALIVTAFIVIAWWIPCTILAFCGCTPFARNWNKTIPGSCIDLVRFFRWNGISNLVIDVIILCLPVPMVWRLSVPARQKLELTAIFALGLFVCVASSMRIVSYRPTQLKDSTYSGVNSMTWSIVEQGIGIVCACLPTLRPLRFCCFARKKNSSKSKSSGSSGYGMGAFKSPAGTITDDHKHVIGKDTFVPVDAGESTVGFAKLQDDGILSPADIQRSVYAPPQAVVPTRPPTAEMEEQAHMPDIGTALTTDTLDEGVGLAISPEGAVREKHLYQPSEPV